MLFQQLDTVVAFAAVMLLLSLMITTAVQAVISLLGLRGRNLFWGVEQLFRQLGPKPTGAVREHARVLAGEILGHDVLADGKSWLRTGLGLGRWGPGEIRLEEIRLVLKQMATRGHTAEIAAAVDGLLGDRAAEVEGVEEKARQLVEGAEAWFETVMDAAADRLKLWNRWWTAGFAVMLAVVLQVDSSDILRQLSSDKVRNQVIAEIDELQAVYSDLKAATEAQAAGLAVPPEHFEEVRQAGQTLESLRQAIGLDIFHPLWSEEEFEARPVGILMTALLLSLGAPFWSGVLGKMVGFRSLVSQREESAARGGDRAGGGS